MIISHEKIILSITQKQYFKMQNLQRATISNWLENNWYIFTRVKSKVRPSQRTEPLGSAHGACEQEHVSLFNAILHKHTRTHVGPYFVRLLVAQWVVIGKYTMGRSLMDRSITYDSSNRMPVHRSIPPPLQL